MDKRDPPSYRDLGILCAEKSPQGLHRTSLKVRPHPLNISEVPDRGSVVLEVVSYLMVRRTQSAPEGEHQLYLHQSSCQTPGWKPKWTARGKAGGRKVLRSQVNQVTLIKTLTGNQYAGAKGNMLPHRIVIQVLGLKTNL